jgi:hypothetical protein
MGINSGPWGVERKNRMGFFSPCKLKETIQWPFQEPKLEVPTIYKAYIRPM